jgi:hypothetical protein
MATNRTAARDRFQFALPPGGALGVDPAVASIEPIRTARLIVGETETMSEAERRHDHVADAIDRGLPLEGLALAVDQWMIAPLALTHGNGVA